VITFISLVKWRRPSCVSLNWHQPRVSTNLLSSSSTRLKQCVLPPQPSYVAMKVCRSETSVKFPLRKCGKWWRVRACQEFRSRPGTNVHPTWAGRRHTPTVRDTCADGIWLHYWSLVSVQPILSSSVRTSKDRCRSLETITELRTPWKISGYATVTYWRNTFSRFTKQSITDKLCNSNYIPLIHLIKSLKTQWTQIGKMTDYTDELVK